MKEYIITEERLKVLLKKELKLYALEILEDIRIDDELEDEEEIIRDFLLKVISERIPEEDIPKRIPEDINFDYVVNLLLEGLESK